MGTAGYFFFLSKDLMKYNEYVILWKWCEEQASAARGLPAHVVHPHATHTLPLKHNESIVHLPLGGEGAEKVIRGHQAGGRRKGSKASFLGNAVQSVRKVLVHAAKGVHDKGDEGGSRGFGVRVVLVALVGRPALHGLPRSRGVLKVGGGERVNPTEVGQEGLRGKEEFGVRHDGLEVFGLNARNHRAGACIPTHELHGTVVARGHHAPADCRARKRMPGVGGAVAVHTLLAHGAWEGDVIPQGRQPKTQAQGIFFFLHKEYLMS